MSGWWVVVDPRTPAERDASSDKTSTLVASWEAGVFNMRWLNALVREGKATQHTYSGYPNRFTILAGDLFPYILNGPPAFDELNTNITIHREKIAALASDHMMTVDVWDNT